MKISLINFVSCFVCSLLHCNTCTTAPPLLVCHTVTDRFVLGGKNLSRETKDLLAPEVADHSDMIILNQVTDEHETLTERTLESFQHIINKDYEFSYVLKCDDDTFVDIKAIVDNLRSMNWKQMLYWGEFVGGYTVLEEGIYAEHNWFVCEKYIPYAFGGGYVLSRDLIELVAQNSPYLQQYMNEDVSLASWLSPYNLVRVHDQKFDTGSDSKGCMKPFIVAHKISTDSMRKYYKSLRREGRMCGHRTRTRKHWNRHMYDWSQPPTQCCKKATL